jgi:hypothetical protein
MSSTGYEMSSSIYETVYEGFNFREKAKAAAEKVKGAAKKVGGSVKKGAVVVAKKAKAAAGWFMWYVRAAQIIFVILIIAYLYKTFVK